jgi:hypothetical protein
MRYARAWIVALAAVAASSFAGSAFAQAVPDGHRDCQVVRACQFARGAAYRGCISSYTCRVCRFVRERCHVAGTYRVCGRMRCTWGG